MDLPRLSRRINKRLGGGEEMLCGRIWRSRRWWLILPLDALFWLMDGRPGHCRDCHLRDHPPAGDVPDRARRAGL